ncbi:MAG TPA: serine hydrolase domain-containing protein, partial [Gemmataceae bacterium]
MYRLSRTLLAAVLSLTCLPAPAHPEEVTPERMKAALAALEPLAEQTLKRTGVPGMAVAVVHRDEVVYLRGFGVRDAAGDDPIDPDTVFQVASVSKPITTTVLAALVGEGVIRWDDRVTDHLPGFRLADPWVTSEVTIRDMLCHRSGLPDHAGDLLEDIGYGRDAVLHRLRYLRLDSSLRAEYAYTNFGFTAGAVAAAAAAGKTWEELAEEKLFRPAGMKSSSFRHADFAKAPNRALPHIRVGGKWVGEDRRRPDAQAPAGGASSSARDMARWVRLLLAGGKLDGRPIIPAGPLAETHRPQVISGYDADTRQVALYGLGWNVRYDEKGRLFWNHSGAFYLGVRSEVSLLPAEQVGIVVLSNAAPTGIPEGMTMNFFDLLLYGKPRRDWGEFADQKFQEIVDQDLAKLTDYSEPPADPSPPLPDEAYLGRYH